MKNKQIQVFEYGNLRVGEKGFLQKHFEQLVIFNEKNGNELFKVGHKRIFFQQFVGVIQIGDLCIEILPKGDKLEGGEQKWQKALLHMLNSCGYIKVKTLPEANVDLRKASLIDLYFDTFLSEVENLIHKGLSRKYRFTEANLQSFKGQIQFANHIKHNLVHKERVYTKHQVYDQNNLLNQILKQALIILSNTSTNQSLISRSNRCLLVFEHVSGKSIKKSEFSRIKYDRKTQGYRFAIQLARLIILHFSPDLKGGREDILAILFDMNKLFEEYMYQLLKRASRIHFNGKINIQAQNRKRFWGMRHLKPDLILEYSEAGSTQKVIIDTKWKVLDQASPSDQDLRQMYAYNLQFEAEQGILLYPNSGINNTKSQTFEESNFISKKHSCRLYFVDLFDGRGRLFPEIGNKILEEIVGKSHIKSHT